MPLKPISDPRQVRKTVRDWQRQGLSVGFVPTMGALHEGHLSLMRASAAECDRTVISIYVNPTQFAAGEDLAAYPRDIARDCAAAQQVGVDLVFAPTDEAMYPDGYATYVVQERLTEGLCGRFRPGHFRGVLTIVTKLFNIVPADLAYFGRKDFQQAVVITRMVHDLNIPIRVRVMPTVREPDGLAMSSRNAYLNQSQRRQATCLYRALTAARRLYASGQRDAQTLVGRMRKVIAEAPDASVEYVEVVDCETLEPLQVASDRAVAALAVRIGPARLIDNVSLAETE